MCEAWLQVIGLTLDCFGVRLIAWEWLTAQRQETAQRAIEEQHARGEEAQAHLARAQPNNLAMQRHFEMTGQMQRRMTKARVGETRAQYSGMRVRAVASGMLLVLVGFLLQLAGAWPGCCRAIGVGPAG